MRNQSQWLIELVRAALCEDVGPGDLTSLGCLEPNPVKAKIVAKQDGVLSGLRPMLLVFHIVDSANTIHLRKNDGDRFTKGETLVEIDGFNQSVLASERVALNFLAHLSGVATLTSRFVETVHGTGAIILDTRKTTPGLRILEKQAVAHGGGQNHRMGLHDMVLIKDNHIASAGSITAAVRNVREFLITPDFRAQFPTNATDIEIEVEIVTESQLVEAIRLGVRRLLLDNQSIDSLRTLVAKARSLDPEVKLEASGNVSLDTVRTIAETGVDYISIGQLTHSAPVADLSMQIVEQPLG